MPVPGDAGRPSRRVPSWENKSRFSTIEDYSKFAKKRFSAAESTERYHYVLTTVKEGKEKGAGLVGIELDSGKADRQILFHERSLTTRSTSSPDVCSTSRTRRS